MGSPFGQQNSNVSIAPFPPHIAQYLFVVFPQGFPFLGSPEDEQEQKRAKPVPSEQCLSADG